MVIELLELFQDWPPLCFRWVSIGFRVCPGASMILYYVILGTGRLMVCGAQAVEKRDPHFDAMRSTVVGLALHNLVYVCTGFPLVCTPMYVCIMVYVLYQ